MVNPARLLRSGCGCCDGLGGQEDDARKMSELRKRKDKRCINKYIKNPSAGGFN